MVLDDYRLALDGLRSGDDASRRPIPKGELIIVLLACVIVAILAIIRARAPSGLNHSVYTFQGASADRGLCEGRVVYLVFSNGQYTGGLGSSGFDDAPDYRIVFFGGHGIPGGNSFTYRVTTTNGRDGSASFSFEESRKYDLKAGRVFLVDLAGKPRVEQLQVDDTELKLAKEKVFDLTKTNHDIHAFLQRARELDMERMREH